MEKEIYLFPFKHVLVGSNVIIYGAGRAGQYLLQEVRLSGYCDVVAVADKNYRRYGKIGVPIIPPDKIPEYDYDKIVVAVKSEQTQAEIKNMIIDLLGIPAERIVTSQICKVFDEKIIEASDDTGHPCSFAYEYDGISMAFDVGHGLGDAIIGKKFICTLAELAGSACCIDLYGSVEYIRAIFDDEPWIKNILQQDMYHHHMMAYDVAINALYLMKIDFLNEENLKKKSLSFYGKINYLKNQLYDYGLNKLGNVANSVHFHRCRLKRRNAYTAYSDKNGIEIVDSHVEIPLKPEGKEGFLKLDLGKYITIHYGWGELSTANKTPAKSWPISHFTELVSMLHKELPDIHIVQIGGHTEEHVLGVDRYLLGESLETVKYILKNSLLHVDIESGLVHVATQLGTKCVVLFGPTPVWYFGYEQNINIVSKECSSCYYLYDDYSLCAREMEHPACMEMISPETVMKNISEYIHTRPAIWDKKGDRR